MTPVISFLYVRSPEREAPWVRQFGNLSIRGNFGFGYEIIVRPSEVKPQLVLKGSVVLVKNKTNQSKEKQDIYFI